MISTRQIFPVILSGGSGTRLWPLSRASLPKQLLPLCGERTMIQETVLRAAMPGAMPPVLLCAEGHRFLVAEQMQQIGVTPSAIVLEPVGRNTAPAAAVAALMVRKKDPQGIVLLLPSDHVVKDEAAFRRAVALASDAAAEGHIVTFGIAAEKPETGYGYIHRGKPLEEIAGVFAVERFTEKPGAETAAQYVAAGDYDWNSGMFVFRADVMIEELDKHAPAILPAVDEAVAKSVGDLDFVRLDKDGFSRAPSISLDYAVMEKTARAAVVPCSIGWSDVGSWSSLWELGTRDAAGNVTEGDVVVHDAQGSYVRSEHKLAALVGVRDLVVISTKDALLIADKSRAQDVSKLVERLKADKRHEPADHAVIYRPWGSYETIDLGHRHQVKHITVKPGGRLSLQSHRHRAEHWVVVEGTAQVTNGEKVFLLEENQSTYIPQGTRHRLENPGETPLHLIEVQSGSYLGEDDIVRYEDVYGRAPQPS